MSVPKVPKPDQAATSACAKNKEGPKPGEHIQLFHMERGRNKGFYTEQCQLEASIDLYFEWAGCLVSRDVLLPFRNIVARTERRVQRTRPFRPYFFSTKLFVGRKGVGYDLGVFSLRFGAGLIRSRGRVRLGVFW